MADKFSTPPQVQAIHSVFKRHIRYYPALTTAFGGNQNCAIVFAEFLYQDGIRLARKAEFFTLTDPQLSERCGIGTDQTKRARDVICDPGIRLFLKERHGSPPINHYQGQYERIYAWLEINGIGRPDITQITDDESNLGETRKLNIGKPANQFGGNPHPLKNLDKKINDDDDARVRERATALESFFIEQNIENPTRNELAKGLSRFEDGLQTAQEICERTIQQAVASTISGNHWMKSGTGMMVSRIRQEISRRQQ